MTTPWSRRHWRHSQISRDAIKSLQSLTKCRRNRWCCIIGRWRWNDRWNLQFSCPVILIPRTEVVGPSPQPGCVKLSSIICVFRKCSMRSCTVLEIVAMTQPGSSFSLTLPRTGSSSSVSSASSTSPSSELARSFKLSPMAFNISSNVNSGLVVVNPTFSAFLISSCFCSIAVSASSTLFLATAVSLST